MKKNDHYFPTVDWIKDPNEPIGWKRITYDSGKAGVSSPEADGVEDVTADGQTGENVRPCGDGADAVPTAGGEETAPTGAAEVVEANADGVNGSEAGS
jgi:hypothetical protein